MSKDNQAKSPEEERRESYATPQGSHKEKAIENQKKEEGQGHLQGIKSNQPTDKQNNGSKNSSRSPQSFDRNEGEKKGQNFKENEPS